MYHKSFIHSLSIICLASLIFSCDDQDSTDIEPVVEEEILITEVPDEEGDLGARPNLGSFAAAPGSYGPSTVEAGKTYTYRLVLPAGHLSRYPEGEYRLGIQKVGERGLVVRRNPWCCNSFRITIPKDWKGEYRLIYSYWCDYSCGSGDAFKTSKIIQVN